MTNVRLWRLAVILAPDMARCLEQYSNIRGDN